MITTISELRKFWKNERPIDPVLGLPIEDYVVRKRRLHNKKEITLEARIRDPETDHTFLKFFLYLEDAFWNANHILEKRQKEAAK